MVWTSFEKGGWWLGEKDVLLRSWWEPEK